MILTIYIVGVLAFGTISTALSVGPSPRNAWSQAHMEIQDGMKSAASCVVDKPVVAHHMVGFTYSYTQSDWANDIYLAAANGLDGFILNMGADPWQPARISDAFAATEAFNANSSNICATPSAHAFVDDVDMFGSSSLSLAATNCTSKLFKLAISFDMGSFPCASSNDASKLRSIATSHSSSSAYLQICTSSGSLQPVLSTFAGEACAFGQAGWQSVTSGFWFAPAFFDMSKGWTGWSGVQASVNWNGAWPQGNSDTSFSNDQTWISETNGKGYVAPASPWFYTHYGPTTYNKNFIYRADNWLWATRWEQLIANRGQVAMVEVVTWNDYTESSYISPFKGDLPPYSEWVTKYDHQGWLKMLPYYIQAFKTGIYPAITEDKFYLWGRLYDKNAQATGDSVPRPSNADYTSNTLWAIIHLAPSLATSTTITLTCGSSTSTTSNLASGVYKLSLPFIDTCDVSAQITRNAGDVTNITKFTPHGMRYSTQGLQYWDFNAFVAST